MDFGKKVEILSQVYLERSDDGDYEDILTMEDYSMPLAALLVVGACTITPIGEGMIEETWIILCDQLQVDPYGDYDSLETMESMVDEG